MTLQRRGGAVTAQVDTSTGAAGSSDPRQLGGYWAVLEDGHSSRVRAGENNGETLHHDHVVRLYSPVPAWAPGQPRTATLQVSQGAPEHPRRVVFVVTDAASQRPLQAVSLAC